jgi:RNA polymerase sigma factor (sigma-70 family)
MTREDTAEDVRLAARIRTGDPQAVEALYERYADPLFAFIFHQLDQARSGADDVWQETWLAAVRALPGYRGESRLFTWLCAIARHKIADRRAKEVQAGPVRPGARGRWPRGAPREEDDGGQALAGLVDLGPLADALLDQERVRLSVVEALALLPEDYRTALVARYADDRPVEMVAALLGRSYKATESLLSRARQALREILASKAAGGTP